MPETERDPDAERFALDALRSVELRAPLRLRERVEQERLRARGPARRRRFALGGVLAGATVAAAVLTALFLPEGAGGPSVVEAAELGVRPPTAAAPAAGEPTLLDVSAFGIPFPDWAESFGWKATGRRTDQIDGREAVTVFYEKDGRQIAYTIVSGDALADPDGASSATRKGTDLSYLSASGRTIVTWERDGHSCILSGSGADVQKLLDLAAWRTAGAAGTGDRGGPREADALPVGPY